MKLLLGIDVEDWFQVENLKNVIKIETWNSRESRIERNTELILSLLKEKNIKATFFVVGWIAEKFPELIKKISNDGHEIACHGYSHLSSNQMDEKELYIDINKAKKILEKIVGDKIYGYRAPNFSISTGLIRILNELGFSYDSSLMDSDFIKKYNKIGNNKINCSKSFRFKNNICELQLSTLKFFNRNIPWAGGAMFRFMPYSIFKKGMEKIISENGYYNFYIHPWEFDPVQPRLKKVKFKYRFRHYHNLEKTEKRFSKLLNDFSFSSYRDYLIEYPELQVVKNLL
ncbi:MAG TPA: polysaccharide deacetylase family protein [Ignavibacteria bacterium]|nr:polysaccharide deacetylase family protein [Ignavibacteria bacterium]